ncbi:ABC transporter ATP-binding protein/permease [uncultured Sphingorhabdus sp.]|uniref:ABC transporter ATP-binding protein/permease n=1 Tax=uncultured Sphingorhabdus sp. TaxID=1686106 RepID=UPI00262A88A0|nr:ATP-binding cassette domain-containing protein [uncultured Sphingorhabdus sp.]
MPSDAHRRHTTLPGRPHMAAVGWRLADVFGAAMFATGLANCISAVAGSSIWFGIGTAVMLIAGGGFLRAVAQFSARYSAQKAATSHKGQLRTRLHQMLLVSGTRRNRLIGEDVRLAIDNPEAIEGHVARYLPIRAAATLSPLLVAVLVAPASWVAAAIMLATLLPFALGMALAGFAARKESDAQLAALTRMSGLFVDRVQNLPSILAFGVEERIGRHLGTATKEVADRTVHVLRIAFASSAIMEFFAALSVALIAVYAGFSLLGLLPFRAPEQLGLAEAFFALVMAPEFYLPIRRLATAYHEKQQGESAALRIDEEVGQMDQADNSAQLETMPKQLELRKVALRYPDGQRIGPVDCLWPSPGLHILHGPTGSGKSSLLKAIAGLMPINQGELVADGTAINPAALTGKVAWAGQTVALFRGDLRINIAPCGTEYSDEALLALAARLGLDSMFGERNGLDAIIDHRGSGLSGGERRRLGLMRAIASGRPLLLLDEPTADLDDVAARAVIDLLSEEAQSRLVIAATHDARLVTASHSVLELQ